jgi:hypothetical protein
MISTGETGDIHIAAVFPRGYQVPIVKFFIPPG